MESTGMEMKRSCPITRGQQTSMTRQSFVRCCQARKIEARELMKQYPGKHPAHDMFKKQLCTSCKGSPPPELTIIDVNQLPAAAKKTAPIARTPRRRSSNRTAEVTVTRRPVPPPAMHKEIAVTQAKQPVNTPPEWYLDLVDRVAEISMDAAYYLEHEAPTLSSFNAAHVTSQLAYIFRFSETPHGEEYWYQLAAQLTEVA